MRFEVHAGHSVRIVEVECCATGEMTFRIDGRLVVADTVQIGPDTYSILLDGRSFEARIQSVPEGLRVFCEGQEFSLRVLDPRAWRGRRSALPVAEGRQQVTAPMPGKVVRVLIIAGQTVEAGQGLVVVEAMKMQNEIRAPKSGTIERLFVRENQAVATGEPLAIIA